MKPIIVEMDEMSDSTEVYGTRPSPVFAGFIYTLVIIIILAVIWMSFFQIDITTHADGMIKSIDATATITSQTSGKLAKCYVEDGDYVDKGDILFVTDITELREQKKACKQELKSLEEQMQMLQAYQQALEGDEAALEIQKENPFYQEYRTRYQAVILNCDSVHSDITTQRQGYLNSINSLDISIQTAEEDKGKLNRMLSDIQNRTNSFTVEEVYYHSAVSEYLNRYELTVGQYDTQIKQLKEAEKSGQKEADYKSQTEALQNEKAQALNQVEAEMLATVEQSITSVENNLAGLQTNRTEAKNNYANLQNGSEEINTDLIIVNEKNAVYAELNTCKSKKTEYETTLASLKTQIEKAKITAQTSGYLNLVADKVVGDYVGNGENLGNIVPMEEGCYQAVIYVQNQDIGRVKEGQKVKYEVYAYPGSDYGTIEGKIQKISKDMKVNEENGSGYYEVVATISCENDEEDVEFMQGMALETRLVTEQKSVLRYLLEKIDLLDG